MTMKFKEMFAALASAFLDPLQILSQNPLAPGLSDSLNLSQRLFNTRRRGCSLFSHILDLAISEYLGKELELERRNEEQHLYTAIL